MKQEMTVAAPQASAPSIPYVHDLDTPLLQFTAKDAWTARDAFEGTQVFGAIGSGKTSGSGATLAKAMLRAGWGGLVLCAKQAQSPHRPKNGQLAERRTNMLQNSVAVEPSKATA